MKIITLTSLMTFTILYSCSSTKVNQRTDNSEDILNEVYIMMSGTFTSAEQSQMDSLFYDISLTMVPIWQEDKHAKWLYVEQAVTEYKNKPYRQRIYKLTASENKIVESSVYELNTPSRFVHAWNNPEIFKTITKDSISQREGCAVYLSKESDCYTGSTKDNLCKSSLRGASYATSIVTVCKDQIVSWDQGWNNEDKHVWGAETEGYIFKKN